MKGELRVVEDVPATFADLVGHARPASVALSGGATARRCYEHLAAVPDLDWTRTEVLFGDERWVPVTHEESNEGMARRVLLERVPVAAIHSMRRAGPTIAEAAEAYDRLVADLGGIDLIHLGLGPDGHTASLFPGSAALDATDRYVVQTAHTDWQRLTFTYAAIAQGRLVVVTVAGSGKHDALRRVREGDPSVPASRIAAESVVWLVDPSAAGG
ncbi:MAG TPA: 6-phosphogluconolactonase [Egibacteraceae bacterium]|nr:6-phosphogluconolactonase [Egibacteraceae bacterium]